MNIGQGRGAPGAQAGEGEGVHPRDTAPHPTASSQFCPESHDRIGKVSQERADPQGEGRAEGSVGLSLDALQQESPRAPDRGQHVAPDEVEAKVTWGQTESQSRGAVDPLRPLGVGGRPQLESPGSSCPTGRRQLVPLMARGTLDSLGPLSDLLPHLQRREQKQPLRGFWKTNRRSQGEGRGQPNLVLRVRG